MIQLIREATEADLSAIFDVERRSYPPELQATHNALRDRFETFGIRVAEVDGEVVGFYTCAPIYLDVTDERMTEETLKQNRHPHYTRWFEQYKKGEDFNMLYVTSTAVSSGHQGKGIGKSLVEHSLELAKQHKLAYRASVLRIPGFRKFQNKGMDINEYIEAIKFGSIVNKMLSLYVSLGFTLGQSLANYEPDRTSANYGVFALKDLR